VRVVVHQEAPCYNTLVRLVDESTELLLLRLQPQAHAQPEVAAGDGLSQPGAMLRPPSTAPLAPTSAQNRAGFYVRALVGAGQVDKRWQGSWHAQCGRTLACDCHRPTNGEMTCCSATPLLVACPPSLAASCCFVCPSCRIDAQRRESVREWGNGREGPSKHRPLISPRGESSNRAAQKQCRVCSRLPHLQGLLQLGLFVV